jgi:hypothetical protein
MNLEEGEGESEDTESRNMRQRANHSQAFSAIEAHPKYSQMSGINFDSVIQGKDYSINKLKHELYDQHKAEKKWRKQLKKLKILYKKKWREFEESLAYLDIEGEQNKILELKTVDLQQRVETEIKLIKAECEEIILERENEFRRDIVMLEEGTSEKEKVIEKIKLAYGELEDETSNLIKNFRGQLIAKEAEFEMLEQQLTNNDNEQMSGKLTKITELERKIWKIKHEHEEEITHLKDQIEKYQGFLLEKDMDNESKLLDYTSQYRKKETQSKSDKFKLKKDMQVS